MVHHSSRIELSQSALRNNLAFIRERIGKNPALSMVVKANAYGHGIKSMVHLARRCGVERFSVASGFEAEEVLAAGGPDCRIMVMSLIYDDDLPWAIENDIEFFVFELARLRRAVEVAREVGRPARIHLEVETGGNRTGLQVDDLPEALQLLTKHANELRFVGFCTHLAGAESLATKFRIDRQLQTYEAARKLIKGRVPRPEFCHVASSAAALMMPERAAMDLVRIGVAAYGLWPSTDVYNMHLMRVNKTRDNPLHRVMAWKSEVLHVKPVKRDEFVGYGTSYQAAEDMRIAVIPLGYANGYPRETSNKGFVLIRGRKAPIVGLVNMNLFMVDVTRIPETSVGDVVVLIGRQKNNVIPISSFSDFSSALNTEFVTRLPSRIPRLIVR